MLFALHCQDELIILVDAPHLAYSPTKDLFKTMSKHPRTGCKEGSVGHAWICLVRDGVVILEGGHSGERGISQPRYFDGVFQAVWQGKKNPVRYLWAVQNDGFFQNGSGGHVPSIAAKVVISSDVFDAIYRFVMTYPFRRYALLGPQCCRFVIEVAKLAGLELKAALSIPIDRCIVLDGRQIQLWHDARFSTLVCETPDVLEVSLKKAIKEGRALDATLWYFKYCKAPKPLIKTVLSFPRRYSRYLTFP